MASLDSGAAPRGAGGGDAGADAARGDVGARLPVRREQIWPTDGIAAWPQLTPARQAWRYDGRHWRGLDPGDSALRP